jgi:hypothetical protein
MIQRDMNLILQIRGTGMRLDLFVPSVSKSLHPFITPCIILIYRQERSSAKRKELYKNIQLKANVATPTQLLLDMKVRWSSTFVMINRAETSKKVGPQKVDNHIQLLKPRHSMLIYLCMRWVCKSGTWQNVLKLITWDCHQLNGLVLVNLRTCFRCVCFVFV